MKRCTAILLTLTLLLLSACGTPAPDPESAPSPVSEPAPPPSSSEASSVPESSSVPEEITPPEPDHTGDSDWPSSGADPITGTPDMGPQDNPDTSVMYTEDENAAWQRENDFVNEINASFSQELPKECYSYWSAYGEGAGNEMLLVLEVGVTDETALDAYLAGWTGTKWDKLVKKPGSLSQAKQEDFAERANKLDMGPNVYLEVRAEYGGYGSENGKIFVSVGDHRWREAEQAVSDFAKEMGIPEDMLSYMIPLNTGSANPDGTITNPDT